MGKSVKRKGNSGGRRGPRYRPDRKPKLQAAPPPLPASVPLPEAIGAAEKDGLGILAGFEAMDSLAPDFGDEPDGEASVMVFEQASTVDVSEAADPELFSSLQDRLSATFAEIEVEAIAAAFCEPLAEAEVEIFEVAEIEPESERAGAPRLPEGHRVCKE